MKTVADEIVRAMKVIQERKELYQSPDQNLKIAMQMITVRQLIDIAAALDAIACELTHLKNLTDKD